MNKEIGQNTSLHGLWHITSRYNPHAEVDDSAVSPKRETSACLRSPLRSALERGGHYLASSSSRGKWEGCDNTEGLRGRWKTHVAVVGRLGVMGLTEDYWRAPSDVKVTKMRV